MTMADELMFEENSGVHSEHLEGIVKPEPGDRVILQHSGKRIHLNGIHERKEGLYEGQINCFETGGETYTIRNQATHEPYQLKKNYQFSFRLKHVFCCIK